MTTAFIDVAVDTALLDTATCATLDAALAAARPLATATNVECEDIALTLLYNALLSLPDGEAFIRSVRDRSILPVPAKPSGGN